MSGIGFRYAAAALVALALPAAPVAAQSWRDVTMSRQLGAERALDVRVSYGAGRFRVHPAEPGLLYRMDLRYDEEVFEPAVEYDQGRLRVGVEGIKNVRLPRDRSGGEMDLGLPRGVSMDLTLEFGAVRADVDLGGLSLSRLDLKTGASDSRVDVSALNPVPMELATLHVGAADFDARGLGNLNAERIEVSAGVGEVTLDFTGDWQRNAHVSVDMGLGSLELRFPEGLGVKLEKRAFLASLDAQGLVKRGEAYYSLDWEQATRRITVDVDAAFGSVDVVWLR